MYCVIRVLYCHCTVTNIKSKHWNKREGEWIKKGSVHEMALVNEHIGRTY